MPDPVRRLPTTLLLVLFGLAATGCAGIPVQEMSNARQAIRAATDAGAAQVAPAELEQAQAMLMRAETSLQQRNFREAREAAGEARRLATVALQAAQERRRPAP